MCFNSSDRDAHRPVVRPRRGHALLELAIVKSVSLIFGIGIAFAIDPSIVRMDGGLLIAVQVDASGRIDAPADGAHQEAERSPLLTVPPTLVARTDEEVVGGTMGSMGVPIDGPMVMLVGH